jgi:hypothetical protein
MNDVLENNHPPYDLVVLIDKLTLALPIDALPQTRRNSITRNLADAASDRGGKKLTSFKKGFKHRYSVPISEVSGQFENALIEYRPLHPERAKYALRIEFNPNKIGPAGCATIRTILKELYGDQFLKLASAMRILAIDPCVDLPGLSCSEVVFHTAEKQVHSAFGKIAGKDSEAETLYFGSPTSDHQVRAYDKRREVLASIARLDKNSRLKITDLVKAADSLKPCMRLEVSLKNLNMAPSELHLMKNPFQSVQMYNLTRLSESPKTDFDRLFFDSVQYQGLSMALARVHHQPTRRSLVRMVSKYRVDWWRPETLGSQLKEAIHLLGILPDAAFDAQLKVQKENGKGMSVGALSKARKLLVGPSQAPFIAKKSDFQRRQQKAASR